LEKANMNEGWNAFLFIAILVIAAIWYNERNPTPPPAAEIGRYQIVTRGEWKGWLIDTATGDTWEWVTITDESGKPTGDRMWSYSLYSAVSPFSQRYAERAFKR
jgi:hypothetical protein